MKVIIHGADGSLDTWDALVVAYRVFTNEAHQRCAYSMTNGVVIFAQRNKKSITLWVQPNQQAE